MKANINTLEELRSFKKLKIKDLKPVISVQHWYNIINWVHNPRETTKIDLCWLFDINIKDFEKLLKNTLKKVWKKEKSN